MLLRGSLNFCSYITWFLDLDHLVGIKGAWLYKEPKVSVLQANAQLAQFSCSKASDANIGIISNVVHLWKTRSQEIQIKDISDPREKEKCPPNFRSKCVGFQESS